MRHFILHTSDRRRSYDLNDTSAFAAEPSGLGNNFSLSYKESERGKHLVNITPSFDPITLKIYFNADGTDGYANYKALLSFLAECGTSPFLFEYNDGVTDKFCEVVLRNAPKSEISEEGLFVEDFQFERQTYWYEQVNTEFELLNRTPDATFPLKFPFGFAGEKLKKEFRITNPFFERAPIIFIISGDFENPLNLYIKDTSGNIISQIQLSIGNEEGQTIRIDPTTKKIIVTTAEEGEYNGYGLTDKTKQSFLYLPQGEYIIGANIEQTDAGRIDVEVRRYLFD